MAAAEPAEVAAAGSTLSFAGAGKRYDDGTQALCAVDVDVAPGQFVTVVGPSGCGKSTLLRLAAGLTEATEGSVHRAAASVGYVFQDPTLLPWRSVRSNVELFGELRGLSRQERRRRADEAISLVGLADFAHARPRTLSGGMRMRVSLARALTLRPDLLLLDEPFGALDEITRERLNDELLRLFAVRRFAALFVTHSVSEAVFLATRIIVLSDRPGRVLGVFDVPFPYPRPPGLRFSGEFTHLAAQVSACLKGAAA
ncbi:ABC transporter ATP-binding protein [Nonomuraea sp. SYSU D8015]|uniref:ABC transporter ATP-binding protein n=1 Tax=Nonomuraea sp. SYSU D8015 TaxID=2593644 RepID=UPI001660FF10|nr:ABC transporter ATP-binding protein [Nonomuraea sp. SYSU D8015]